MATVRGELVEIGIRDFMHDVGAAKVMVLSGNTVVGAGELDRDGRFEVEVPDGIVGQLELRVGTVGAAPVFFEAGSEGDLIVMYNRGGTNLIA